MSETATRCRIEIHEGPAWLDDCFRSSLWTKFQGAAGESFLNAGDVTGDYATMSVTEAATPSGCGWQRSLESLAAGTDQYPQLRVRLRGRGETPQYQLEVEYTDSYLTQTGWTTAPTLFEDRTVNLTPGKTVKMVRLYARSATPYGSAQIDYDYASVQAQPPIAPGEQYDVEADLRHTVANSSFRIRCWLDALSGVTGRLYPLDSGSGLYAYDTSPGRGHGKIQGATWTTGYRGWGLLFAGTNRLDTGYKPTVTGALTLCLWVKAQSGATGIIVGAGKAVSGGWNRVQINFTGDTVRVYARDDALNVLQATATSVVANGSWHHVAAVVNPASDRVTVLVDGVAEAEASGTLGAITLDAYDFTLGCLHNESGYSNYAACTLDEAGFFERAFTAAEVTSVMKRDPPSGVSRVAVGSYAMIYVAAAGESLIYKLASGRVLDRTTGGDADRPYLELVGEDLGEVIHDRTWSRDYQTGTEISTMVTNLVGDSVNELYRDVDTTNRMITNRFSNENCWRVLEKLAETASFSTGEVGADFWVDVGGCLRWKRRGVFQCGIRVTDGSDGFTPNILDIRVRESLKAEPRLANDVKVVVFEEEAQPGDLDGYTESAEGWTTPDPTDVGYPQSCTGDKVAGSASVKYQTTNPGYQYRMRLAFSDIDLSGYDSLRFDLKYGSGLTVDSFEVRLQKGGWTWTSDYWEATGIIPPGSGSWNSVEVALAGLTAQGSPGNVANNLQIRAVASSQIGTGGFLLDGLHFLRWEKTGEASDSASQAAYGKRSLTVVDKTLTSTGYAGYLAGNLLAHRKNPTVTVQCTVTGRGQPGFRPAMTATVTSLKDGLKERSFQITRARHRVTQTGGYTCELELSAARTSGGGYTEQVGPTLSDLAGVIADLKRRQEADALGTLRRNWP